PMPSLVNILPRCHSTVRADRNSLAPISGLLRPSRGQPGDRFLLRRDPVEPCFAQGLRGLGSGQARPTITYAPSAFMLRPPFPDLAKAAAGAPCAAGRPDHASWHRRRPAVVLQALGHIAVVDAERFQLAQRPPCPDVPAAPGPHRRP